MGIRRPVWQSIAATALVALVLGHDGTTADAADAPKPATMPSVNFVVTCAFSHQSDDDPIVHPGHAGMSHRHDFFGNKSTDFDSTNSSLASADSTCNVSGDRSAYWLPTLLPLRWGSRIRAYYSRGPLPASAITAFPIGLQLIGGDVRASATGSVAAEYSCSDDVDGTLWRAVPPPCSGPVSARVTFPQCWNGRSLSAPGNATPAIGRDCPKEYPVAMPLLRLVATSTSSFRGKALTTSAGPPARLHADFWNAWDPEVLNQLVAVCIRGERASNREIKHCRGPGTGPASVGSGSTNETNF